MGIILLMQGAGVILVMCILARAHNLLYQAKELFSFVYGMLEDKYPNNHNRSKQEDDSCSAK